MRALLLRGPNRPFDLVDMPDPVAGPGEAVARVLTCGSGLTIQHIKAGRIAARFPTIIGHEITAEIVEVGAGVTAVKEGDAVTSYYYLNCGHCRWCYANLEPLCENSGGNVGITCNGGYAEYIKLPAHLFIKFPASLDYKAHPAECGVVMRRAPFCRYSTPTARLPENTIRVACAPVAIERLARSRTGRR